MENQDDSNHEVSEVAKKEEASPSPWKRRLELASECLAAMSLFVAPNAPYWSAGLGLIGLACGVAARKID